jgi:hypothetical protein
MLRFIWLKLALLYICIRYIQRISPETLGTSARPLSFWQWPSYSQYIEFLSGFMFVVIVIILENAFWTFVQTLFGNPFPHLWSVWSVYLRLGLRCTGSGVDTTDTSVNQVSCFGSDLSTVCNRLWDSNHNQKSLYGFRASTLIGWFGGDSFK